MARQLTLEQFAQKLEQAAADGPGIILENLEVMAREVVHDAKEIIGSYQRDDMGPFQPWQELAPETKLGRLRDGYSENDPLLRDGDLRHSISHEMTALGFVVGSTDQNALYQEMGTATIPPRPFLGLALWRNTPLIIKSMLKSIGKAME